MKTLEERFWTKVDKSIESGCWEWLAFTNKKYGVLKGLGGRKGKVLAAHRVSWEIHNGVIPEGLCVLHRCDNPKCVNPDHLFLGTQKDNVDDMMNKGRAIISPLKNGEQHPRTKLTHSAVRGIRELNGLMTHKDIAELYGVCRTNITHVLNNTRWVSLVVENL